MEDQGGEATAELIRARFGDRVAELVLHCTDSIAADASQKLPWSERKTAYLTRLAQADQASALIAVADKLHNITAMIRDVREQGPDTLKRFNQPEKLVWYFQGVANAVDQHRHSVPLHDLETGIAELTILAQARSSS